MNARWVATLALAAAVGGCKDEPGELDPQTVHDLSRAPGSARGLALTGDYDAELTLDSCTCPDLGTLAGLSLCLGVGPVKGEMGDSYYVQVEIVQADGLLLLQYDDFSLTGPVEADGTFAVGGVFDMTTLVTSGNMITRVDGQFDPDTEGEVGFAAIPSFESVVRHRLDGEAAPGLGELDSRATVDCVETFTLTGRQRQ